MTVALLTVALAAASSQAAPRLIQIRVMQKSAEAVVKCAGEISARDSSGQRHIFAAGEEVVLTPASEGIKAGSLYMRAEVRISPRDSSQLLLLGGKSYPGSLIFRRNPDASLTVIDELGIEEYLLGVLPHEMDADWPLEALKAQAVVARTFAYTQLGRFRKSGFDLTSDTRSQVFGGLGEASPVVRLAVRQTKAEVLGYKGRILPAFYHACCGGHTANAGAVWGQNGDVAPPLRGVKDRYCVVSPLARWKAFFSYDDIVAALQRNHLFSGVLRRFEIARRDMISGHVRSFLVKIGRDEMSVKADDLRQGLGASEFRSARVSRIRKVEDGIEFIGSGSGHGVGLCQWGAKIQAEKGRSYEQILQFYFPSSVLAEIDE
ncbi:MAG: SpoIID/LytB domain-containing protein [Elusimicrobia bacterium]|nr:SpoIID/LytB domain-containing protein [Elusimicrobiota bacterium]